MTMPSFRLRAFAMLLGLILLAGIATPARALEPYPGETREAFVARSAMEQQRKLAQADAAAGALTPGLANSGKAGGLGGLQAGAFGLGMLLLGGWRMSRGIFRASRSLTKRPGGQIAGVDTFEDRLAERLRELDQATPAAVTPTARPALPVEPMASAPPPPRSAMPAAPVPAGQRTFGRRTS